MPRLKAAVRRTLPAQISRETPYAVLYIRATDNIDAIECANEWARANGFIRARELTLSRANVDDESYFVARCYRLAPGEK